jgi:two-component system, sensor histidine kinase SagS
VNPPRVLVLGTLSDEIRERLVGTDLTVVPDVLTAMQRLMATPFEGVVADAETARNLLASQRLDAIVLANIDKGVAVLDQESRLTWANPAMQALCQISPIGQKLMEALGASTLVSEVADPLKLARNGTPVAFHIYRPASVAQPYLDITIQPVIGADGVVEQQVVFVRNITSEVEQQRRLDALHQAGRELADIDPDQLAEMNVPTRVELLKKNLRRYIHDLLHYDIIEVRLLDRRTGELRPLLEDGMTTTAAHRVLYARETANGVTGYVAASGQSYLCMDTAHDPLYLEGASGARSSMTVPLKHNDEVVGTLNVESPRLSGFGPDDLQFTELFSKEIATALHTLDLLTAQQSCTMTQSVDLINREIAIPLDNVMASTALLLEKFEAENPEVAEQLQRILAGARQVKESLRKVERDMHPEREQYVRRSTPLVEHRVLIIDAEERSRKQAHLMLGQLGAEVETVGTALEGIALLKAIPFDAVLMEIKPTDLGGYETYRRLKLARPDVRIAMTTGFGYDSAHSIVKARADGMEYVLFKPFRQDQILKAILVSVPITPQPNALATAKLA